VSYRHRLDWSVNCQKEEKNTSMFADRVPPRWRTE